MTKIRILFFGTPDFAVPGLEALVALSGLEVGLVVTQPDRPSGRGGKLTPSPVKQCAERHRIPVFQPKSLKRERESFAAKVAEHGPFDLGVVIAFGQILPKTVLDAPRLGCVNIHASLLPRWRGAAPIQRAILSGDERTGVCLMQMDEGLDTGPVYARAEIEIASDETGGTLHDRLAALGAALLKSELFRIALGVMRAEPQPEHGVTYASKIEAADCAIEWSQPAAEIARKVRAFAPFPGAYTHCGDKRLKIFAARAIHASPDFIAAPGEIVSRDEGELTVCCGDGELAITEVQLEGKRRMPAGEFLRGHSLPPHMTMR